MVAISVILAAVVGAFVLEVGNSNEAPPSTSFTYNQEVKYYVGLTGGNAMVICDPERRCDSNLSAVTVTHAGGDTIPITQLNIKINGNTSVWGVEKRRSGADSDIVRPRPDHFRAARTNDPVYVSSGNVWNVYAYKGFSDEIVRDPSTDGPFEGFYTQKYGCKNHETGGLASHNFNNPSVSIASAPSGYADICTDRLQANDRVSVVWHAKSGGSTQTLTQYTVRSDSSPGPSPR
jgi:hypothetical protein